MSYSCDLRTQSFEIDFGSMAYLCDATTYSMTVSLPNISNDSSWNGAHCYVKRIDSTAGKSVTIDCFQSQTLDGNLSLVLAPNDSVHIMAYDGNWLILSNN